MTCFAQNGSGDLDFTSGNLSIVRDLDEATAIKLTNRFKLFSGEWFIDTRIGIPYYEVVYVKNPDLTLISQLFKRVLLDTPRVKEVLELNVNFISNLRQLNVDFKVQTDSGAIIEGGPGLPFIVKLNGKGQS